MSSRVLAFSVLAAVLLMAVIAAAIAATDDASYTYRVGPEDVINVLVVRHPEFSGEFLIPTDGVVNLPAAGEISVSGKTLGEIAECVKERLRARLREPEVTATLRTARMQRVYVLGAVAKSGPYDIKPGWRITEALAAAGGLAERIEPADCRAVILKSAGGERITVPLTQVFAGAAEANAVVNSGDVLTIEARETMPVYVSGNVKNPGVYRLCKDSAGVMEALTLAGGTLPDACLSRITIKSVSGSSRVLDLTPVMVQGQRVENVKVETGDLIVVPEETSRIAVLGYVNAPNFYPLRSGQALTLSDALGLAKGIDNKQGQMSSIAVIRNQNGKRERLVFDLRKFLKSGDFAHNPEIKPGDVIYVPRTGGIDMDTVFRALTSVGILAGSVLPW